MSEQGAQMIADRWVEDPAFRKLGPSVGWIGSSLSPTRQSSVSSSCSEPTSRMHACIFHGPAGPVDLPQGSAGCARRCLGAPDSQPVASPTMVRHSSSNGPARSL